MAGHPVCTGDSGLTPARAFSPTGILPRSWSHYTVPAGMTVIQWVSDFSERIKQLQNISLAAASGGAKELKVVTAAPEQPGGWGEQQPGRWGGGQAGAESDLGGQAGSLLTGLLLPTEHPRVSGRPVCA